MTIPELKIIIDKLPPDYESFRPLIVDTEEQLERFDVCWELFTGNSAYLAADPQEAQRALAYGSM